MQVPIYVRGFSHDLLSMEYTTKYRVKKVMRTAMWNIWYILLQYERVFYFLLINSISYFSGLKNGSSELFFVTEQGEEEKAHQGGGGVEGTCQEEECDQRSSGIMEYTTKYIFKEVSKIKSQLVVDWLSKVIKVSRWPMSNAFKKGQ